MRTSKERSLLIGLVFTLAFSVVIIRLFWIQTVQSDEYLTEAQSIYVKESMLRPKRGVIFDRSKKHEFAWEADAYYFIADHTKIKDPEKTARVLAPILEIDESILQKKLEQRIEQKRDIEFRHGAKFKYPEEVVRQIQELQKKDIIQGIHVYSTTTRQYHGSEAAHIIGFMNADDQAVGGVEKTYNQWLRGQEGYAKYISSKSGVKISEELGDQNRPAVPGKDLVLTIDARIQNQVERELDQAMETYQAKGAIAIVSDPKNGEILAMASRPVFDPNKYAETLNDENARNRAIESQFEPGSTFKIVTLAAGIEEGLFKPEATFESGSIEVGDRTIRDWKTDGWGTITYRQGVELSSNVAFVKLGQQLGEKKLVSYVDQFGFGNVNERLGKKTGIDLPAEGRGYFFNRRLYPSELASTAFGQGISVTPIQQVAAINAIANDGVWNEPHLMKEIWDSKQNQVIQSFKPKGHRIVQPSTAQQVRKLLRGVVKNGTAREAEVPGFQVAGKTGTAQKPDPEGKGYHKDKYVVSFVGFAPYENPELVVYVALDEPSATYGNVSGGSIAAPVARDILKMTLPLRGIQPNKEAADSIK
ncbi:peptidoglycan D,D-transpeptidase FtsI family protein [Hazenella coriacea]|nr:penicillin-binding transpeptidase domain-containing protein [Hazenella coriacea]